MTSYRVRVCNGRLILDVPTTLPEGSEVELTASRVDDLGDLDDEERRRLLAQIAAADADEQAGRFEDADEALRKARRA